MRMRTAMVALWVAATMATAGEPPTAGRGPRERRTLGLALGPAAQRLATTDVIAVSRELNFVAVNAGRWDELVAGTEFMVMRDRRAVARVRVVDVRETIAGAVIEDVEGSLFPRVGDALVRFRERRQKR